MNFSGCLQDLYLIRDGALQSYKTDKTTLGLSIDGISFNSENIKLEKGDLIYLFSDGYPDQFGGPKNKKFKYGPFRELLLSIHKKDMKEQEDILEETIRAWRLDYLEDGYEQIDDISIIGLRV